MVLAIIIFCHLDLMCHFVAENLKAQVFQDNDNDYRIKKEIKKEIKKGNQSNSSWEGCIYLKLYQHIVKHLILARDYLLRLRKTHAAPTPCKAINMFSQDYFCCIIAKKLVSNCPSGDAPYLWKTSKGNRKKHMGVYQLVGSKTLLESANQQMFDLEQHQNEISTPISLLDLLPNLGDDKLFNILKTIPYTLVVPKKAAERTAEQLSMLHVLAVGIVYVCCCGSDSPFQWNKFLKTWTTRAMITKLYLAIENGNVLMLEQQRTPTEEDRIQFQDLVKSRVHKLWGSPDSFFAVLTKVKRQIAYKLRNNKGVSYLRSLEDTMKTISFKTTHVALFPMLKQENKFIGLNERIVYDLKVVCLMCSRLELKKNKNWGNPGSEGGITLLYIIEMCGKRNRKELVDIFQKNKKSSIV